MIHHLSEQMLTCLRCAPTGHWRGGACRGRGELCGDVCAVRTPPAGSGCRAATCEAAPPLRGRACSPAPAAPAQTPGSRSSSHWESHRRAPRSILLWAPLLGCSCRQRKNSACGLTHQWFDLFNSRRKQRSHLNPWVVSVLCHSWEYKNIFKGDVTEYSCLWFLTTLLLST